MRNTTVFTETKTGLMFNVLIMREERKFTRMALLQKPDSNLILAVALSWAEGEYALSQPAHHKLKPKPFGLFLYPEYNFLTDFRLVIRLYPLNDLFSGAFLGFPYQEHVINVPLLLSPAPGSYVCFLPLVYFAVTSKENTECYSCFPCGEDLLHGLFSGMCNPITLQSSNSP